MVGFQTIGWSVSTSLGFQASSLRPRWTWRPGTRSARIPRSGVGSSRKGNWQSGSLNSWDQLDDQLDVGFLDQVGFVVHVLLIVCFFDLWLLMSCFFEPVCPGSFPEVAWRSDWSLPGTLMSRSYWRTSIALATGSFRSDSDIWHKCIGVMRVILVLSLSLSSPWKV